MIKEQAFKYKRNAGSYLISFLEDLMPYPENFTLYWVEKYWNSTAPNVLNSLYESWNIWNMTFNVSDWIRNSAQNYD